MWNNREWKGEKHPKKKEDLQNLEGSNKKAQQLEKNQIINT